MICHMINLNQQLLLRPLEFSNCDGCSSVSKSGNLSYVVVQERVCEDSASFDLTSADLAQCIADMQHILMLKKEEFDAESENGRFMKWGGRWGGGGGKRKCYEVMNTFQC